MISPNARYQDRRITRFLQVLKLMRRFTMKTTLCAVASGLALAFAGTAAFATSTGTTVQGGYNNDAGISQAFNSDATATIGQLGVKNVANARQNNTYWSNDISVKQLGYNNTANANQTSTGDADSSIKQFGVKNVANTNQSYGTHQDASVLQVGYNNTANVTQIGSSLNATAMQFGAKNVSTISQRGW
jgi:hypothetical protein